MAKGNHSFTEQDIRKRFGAIVGHTVAEVDAAGVLTASAASRNKGRIGAVIEQSVLGYPADSDRRPDIVIDGQPWEVKATGLKESARGGWRAKEPMSITAVAPEGIVTESFSTSAFWHKAARLLVVYYLYVRPGRGVTVEYAGFEFKGYDLHTWHEVDRCRLEADWTTVREFVRTALAGDVDTEMPNLSTLINPQLLYLDTSPKWPNRPRFRLKASLVTQMARERLDDGMRMIPDQGGLSSMGALKAYLHGISNTYAGQTLEDLAMPFGLPLKAKSGRENKSLAEQVVVRLFTGHAGKISQVPLFAKAGIVFKTMTLTPAGGRTEDMKLNPSIDFDELCDPDIDCDVLFQYCDLREIFEPLGYINVALQYDALPYRKWSNPLDLKEIGMDDLSLHEKCALQLGWELAGKDDSRDRADMSVDELIDFGESEAENRDLVVWLHGYMDPYEGEIDTARYSKEYIIESCEQVGFDIDFSRLPEPEESLDDMARAAESALEEKKENGLEGEHEEEIPF